MAQVLGIDVGGSGVKGAIVDTASGTLLTERHRIETPDPATPAALADIARSIVQHFDYDGTVGCCFPSVIVGGVAQTAGNIDPSWRRTNVADVFGAAAGKPFVVLNDADAAGVAEMRLGTGRGLDGLVIMITIGTGLGSGVFYNGQLVPNIELGFMPGPNDEPIERYAGNRARKQQELGWDEWGDRLNYFLAKTSRMMSPDHLILGGGVIKKLDQFRSRLTVSVPIHEAAFGNNAGIVGAALLAEEAD